MRQEPGTAYDLLHVHPAAPLELISAAYWDLVYRVDAPATRALLTRAYEVLADHVSRAAYDLSMGLQTQAVPELPRTSSSWFRRQPDNQSIDLYEILRVSPSADSSILEEAYRIMREYYLRAIRSGVSDGLVDLVEEAFEVLTHPERRQAYDRSRAAVDVTSVPGSVPVQSQALQPAAQASAPGGSGGWSSYTAAAPPRYGNGRKQETAAYPRAPGAALEPYDWGKLLAGSIAWLDRHALRLLMSITITLSLVSLAWSYDREYIVLYPDALAHLNISRRVVDNLTPGFAQLGSSWLPLQHILQLPFIWNDYLWHSGLAGSIVSVLSFWGSAYLIFRLLEKLVRDRTVSFLGSLLFVTNVNMLYMQTTPMGESLFIFLLLGSAYYLVRWAQEERLSLLVAAGLFGFLSAVSRYEGWWFVSAEVIIVGVIAWQKYGRRAAEGFSLSYAYLAGSGAALWLIWNLVIFGNPLNFLFDSYSSRQRNVIYSEAGLLPGEGDILASIKYYAVAFFHTGGPALALALPIALVVLIYLLLRKRDRPSFLPLLALAAPGLMLILATYRGIAPLWVEEFGPLHEYFNVRYGLFSLPLAILIVPILARGWRGGQAVMAGLVVLQLAFPLFSSEIATLKEPLRYRAPKDEVAVEFGALYDGGLVLAGAGVGHSESFMFHSGLPMKTFIHEGTREYWKSAVKDPRPLARWVIIAGDPNTKENELARTLGQSPILQNDYDLVAVIDTIKIYRQKGEGGLDPPTPDLAASDVPAPGEFVWFLRR